MPSACDNNIPPGSWADGNSNRTPSCTVPLRRCGCWTRITCLSSTRNIYSRLPNIRQPGPFFGRTTGVSQKRSRCGGVVVFADQWNRFCVNKRVPGFRYEAQCSKYVNQLQQIWDGGISSVKRPVRTTATTLRRAQIVQAVMISCPERKELLRKTLKNLARTDWDAA